MLYFGILNVYTYVRLNFITHTYKTCIFLQENTALVYDVSEFQVFSRLHDIYTESFRLCGTFQHEFDQECGKIVGK